MLYSYLYFSKHITSRLRLPFKSPHVGSNSEARKMLEIQRERLPQAYLLILSGTVHESADAAQLTRALHSASRTGKSAIVVDFTMVEELSESVVELLLAYAAVLYTQNRRLALCHVPQTSQHRFLHPDAAFQPLLVMSVLDAIYEVEFALNSPVMAD